MGGLILGRSSASMLGLFIIPGVIDADYQGKIYVMAYMPWPPITVQQGQRFAQIVPLQQQTVGITPREIRPRGSSSFGSSDNLVLLSVGLGQRPKQHITIVYKEEKISLSALLDTGADSSIISSSAYPKHWPCYEASGTVTGVGGMIIARQTPLLTVNIDDYSLSLKMSILPLPLGVACLLGRNVLSQLGFRLTNDKKGF